MWTDNASQIDMLFYKPYAKIVSDIAIETSEDPLTVGVFGLWGAGKSTLLNLVQQNYKEKEGIICVTINAWMFESYEDAKVAIMEALLQELEECVPKEELKKKFRGLRKRVDLFKVGTKVVSTAAPVIASIATGNPLPLILNLPSGAKEIGDTIKNLSDSAQNMRETYLKDVESEKEDGIVNNVRKFRREFEKSLENEDIKRVVVLVDDLDRCQPERIIDTLEAIKLFLSVNRTTFIVAADENVIKYSIKQKYPPLENFTVELDNEYIEKIIQLPIQIPELSSKDIQNYLLLLVMQKYMKPDIFSDMIAKIEEQKLMISEAPISLEQLDMMNNGTDVYLAGKKDECLEVVNVILGIRQIAAYTLKGNPRQAKRFLNTFITKRQLSKLYYGDELDMRILAKLLVLNKLSSELFDTLNEWNKNFETDNEQFRIMREGMKEQSRDSQYHKWYKKRILSWIKCEPEELERFNLDKYFYLTREILNKTTELESDFSDASKKILERIGSVSSALVPKLLDDMKKLDPADLEDVLKIVIKKTEQGKIESFLYMQIFIKLEAYRNELMDAILKSNIKIGPSDMASLTSMYKCDSDIVEPILKKMVENKMMSEDVMKIVTKEGN
ncbi:P-loop NTPase fold protein [Clostridium sp.]|jgi:energy-coupling factor transporter ATP-binding protein EcfA2|uniref:KAP family P-loop NTPase fold protein n=1 Tax=Clostridium sp. TaxID=1506 RepID=UPI002586B83B|nr:P-loop NTPase fold protein [Clostridium sp.]MDF2503030.1 family P-loop domain [Clostridium sp.]